MEQKGKCAKMRVRNLWWIIPLVLSLGGTISYFSFPHYVASTHYITSTLPETCSLRTSDIDIQGCAAVNEYNNMLVEKNKLDLQRALWDMEKEKMRFKMDCEIITKNEWDAEFICEQRERLN